MHYQTADAHKSLPKKLCSYWGFFTVNLDSINHYIVFESVRNPEFACILTGVISCSMFAPISRQEAELIQQQAPPSYGQLIAQGIIPPVEDFPTENPNEVSAKRRTTAWRWTSIRSATNKQLTHSCVSVFAAFLIPSRLHGAVMSVNKCCY